MAKRFDAATKHLVEAHPGDWVALAGLPAGTGARVVDTDVSAVSAAADKVIRVDGPAPYLAHLEFQSVPDADLDLRVLGYNVGLRVRHRLPVWSAVFLLRPEAAGPGTTGWVHDAATPGGSSYAALEFRYRIVRVWEQPPEAFLAGGLGTVPLAPIAAVPGARVAAVIGEARQRLERDAPPGEVREMMAALFILLGLRYSRQQVAQFLQGVRGMEESDTYQAIIEKGVHRGHERGKRDEARAVLLRIGRKAFGPPDPATAALVAEIEDLGRLEALADRVFDRAAASWDELLAD